jgi:hypothetical protein
MHDELNILVNGGGPQFVFKCKTTSICFQVEDNLKQIMQPKTIKNNACGTALVNQVT